jgi:predicted transcriptional regulator
VNRFTYLIAGVLLLFVLCRIWKRRRREDEKKVLDLLARKPGLYLAQISTETGMSISNAIVTTFRLEHAGKLVSQWQDEQQPRKRLYSIA